MLPPNKRRNSAIFSAAGELFVTCGFADVAVGTTFNVLAFAVSSVASNSFNFN